MNDAATEARPGSPVREDARPFCVLDEHGELDASVAPALAPSMLMRMYREMRRVRVLDERMVTLHRQGRVGFYGACTGQEAAVVATGLAVAPHDWVFPALRENAIMLVRGFSLDPYIAQIFGGQLDPLHGRQMPVHVSSKSVHQVSWSSCIGTQLPHAVGAAWAAKLKKDPMVAVAFLGDGATSTADFHGALNFAGVFRVPIVFVCQNNQWAISVPVARQTASETLAIKARAYGIASNIVDGNDVVGVYHALSSALDVARSGGGATLLELFTYRVAPHSTSDDPSRYRAAGELEAWQRRDPLQRLGRHLRLCALLGDATERQIDDEVNAELARAIERAEGQGRPSLSTLFDDVYAEQPWHLVEQRQHLERARGKAAASPPPSGPAQAPSSVNHPEEPGPAANSEES